jgi:RNA polymerase sigma-70 factor (ECF subfamily)
VQDVLVAVLENRSRFRGESTLRTWITRIAVNQCRAQRRKKWLRQKLWRAWAEREPRPQESGVDPDAGVHAAERRSAVRAAIAKLPASFREAIVLHYLENLSVAETAAALRVRRGTVEVRLSRARAQLRDMLPELAGDAAEYWPEGGDD